MKLSPTVTGYLILFVVLVFVGDRLGLCVNFFLVSADATIKIYKNRYLDLF